MLILVSAVQELNTSFPIDLTLVRIVTDVIEQPEKALLSIDVTIVEMTMSPLQHALDGLVLLTQPGGDAAGIADGANVGYPGSGVGTAEGRAVGATIVVL